MSFNLSCWDHARQVKNKQEPYDELCPEMARKKAMGIDCVIAFMPTMSNFAQYCRAAREAGIAVQSWITPRTLIENPVDRCLPEEQWQKMEKIHGIRLNFPCLNHPQNQESFISLAQDLLAEYGSELSALHLDAIRFENAILQYEFPCECEACRALRKKFFGKEELSAKERLEPSVVYKEIDIKNDSVSGIVRRLKTICEKQGLALTMAARANYLNQPDIFVNPVWGLGPALLEGQDWVKWCDNGWVDEAYSMNYHPNEAYFSQVLEEHMRLTRDSKAVFKCGIATESSMGVNPPERVAKYLREVKEAGLPGCVFFNKNDVFSPEYEKAIKAAVLA
ncbi:MAG: hypothetical protein PHG44_02370 [Lentisphaeria bacterium]|nr:hypothetical protein [Lentisphaeria bacterium]MDY0175535.1 hypothetical protein [Lentisphaeria bacterium]NLZ60024.1 hypothetical protein [Lentisphaerota bacterium]